MAVQGGQGPQRDGGWSRRKRITVWSASGVFGFLLIMWIIGTVVGPPKEDRSAAAADSQATSASPSATTAAPVTTTPSAPATSTAPSPKPTTAPPATPAKPSPKSTVATAADRAAAEKILKANDIYYQDEFNRGVTVTLARGGSGSFADFSAWDQKAASDVQPGMTAFSKADAHFNADNEPDAINDWRFDNGNLTADVAGLAQDGLDVGGPDDAAARQKVAADTRQMKKDFAAAQKDASKVGAAG